MTIPKECILKTGKEGFYDITSLVENAIKEVGIEEGLALIYCPHTSAGVTLTENTDPDVTKDMLVGIGRAFPEYEDFKHKEGNSFAHIRSSILGCQVALIVSGGWPLLGPFQAIYFAEFDGPRERRFYVKVIEG